jgi:hypothetical protein
MATAPQQSADEQAGANNDWGALFVSKVRRVLGFPDTLAAADDADTLGAPYPLPCAVVGKLENVAANNINHTFVGTPVYPGGSFWNMDRSRPGDSSAGKLPLTTPGMTFGYTDAFNRVMSWGTGRYNVVSKRRDLASMGAPLYNSQPTNNPQIVPYGASPEGGQGQAAFSG